MYNGQMKHIFEASHGNCLVQCTLSEYELIALDHARYLQLSAFPIMIDIRVTTASEQPLYLMRLQRPQITQRRK